LNDLAKYGAPGAIRTRIVQLQFTSLEDWTDTGA